MKNKDLTYFLSLIYTIHIEREELDGEKWYIAYSTELGRGSCYGLGDTPEDALSNFYEAKEDFIEFLFDRNRPIPEPKKLNLEMQMPSGNFNVRTSPEIHFKLIKQSQEYHISLNLHINHILASSSYGDDIKKSLENKILDIGQIIDNHHKIVLSNFIQYKLPSDKTSQKNNLYDDFSDLLAVNFK